MTIGYGQIILGTQTLHLKSLSKTKVPGTLKQKLGGNLIQTQIPGRTVRDWRLSGNGVIFDSVGTTATAFRTTLESYNDQEPLNYSDGMITASVIIENLTFPDDESRPMHYEYTISLIEYQQ